MEVKTMGIKRFFKKKLPDGSLIEEHISDALQKTKKTGEAFTKSLAQSVKETLSEELSGASYVYDVIQKKSGIRKSSRDRYIASDKASVTKDSPTNTCTTHDTKQGREQKALVQVDHKANETHQKHKERELQGKMSKAELKKRRAELRAQSDALWKDINEHRDEEKRIVNVLHNAESILAHLDETFEQRTSLSKTDMSILMIATALQLIRIYLLPKFQEKYLDENRLDHNDGIIKNMEREEIEKYKKDHKNWASKKSEKGYRSWQEIAFTIKVPYDATRHSGKDYHNRNMHGGQHRVKTLGHDPVLGWIFGVANIISDTITICPEYELGEKKIRLPLVESYNVDMGSNFCWKDSVPTWDIFKNSFESIGEDKHRLYAALFAQGLHLASDQYTKLGLPVPFLTLIDSDKAYDIYKEGYDYLDYLYDTQILRRSLKSASQAIMINMIIGALHKFFYNPNKDFDKKLYNVRTRKIILYSNMIATTSDVVQTAIRAYAGDENSIKNFDFGGFLVTVYRLMTDTKTILRIKEEFIFNEWDKIIESKDNIFNI